jgi:hypothetical protein
MGDDYDEDRARQERFSRRMPYTASAALLALLAVGVFAGVGLRGWTIALPMLIVAAALVLWSLRI